MNGAVPSAEPISVCARGKAIAPAIGAMMRAWASAKATTPLTRSGDDTPRMSSMKTPP